MKPALYLRLKQQIRGWLPSDQATSIGTGDSHGHILWYFVAAAILGILIYAPLIPVHGTPDNANYPASICYGCIYNPPHVNSITTQFLGFGTQYYYGQYGGLSIVWGGVIGFDVLLWGNLLIAISAVTVALLVSFISSRNALKGASFQLGVGVLSLISPALVLYLGVEPMWLNILLAEEITNAGAVLLLTAIAELWWFKWSKRSVLTARTGFATD